HRRPVDRRLPSAELRRHLARPRRLRPTRPDRAPRLCGAAARPAGGVHRVAPRLSTGPGRSWRWCRPGPPSSLAETAHLTLSTQLWASDTRSRGAEGVMGASLAG